MHTLTFGQSWLETPLPALQPATVQLRRVGDTLELEARICDTAIHSPAAKFNEMAYTKGDVFELFIKGEGDSHYHEIHVTPDNVLLQLRFEVGAKRPFDIPKALVWEPLLTSSTERFEGGWIARFSLPLGNISSQKPLPTQWKVGCGRYDYKAQEDGSFKPILSNTAPITACDFHRHQEWPVLDLV